ncbi:MAG: DUF1919 domain-containing protein [Selenomonadaceae bacterium]|nr:DUF1919 domain-containing protein [Selenomonadaceae bacterium]
MNIVLWCQGQPNFGVLNNALQVLAQKYGSLSIMSVVDPAQKWGGVMIGNKPLPVINKNELPNVDYDLVVVTGQNFLLKNVLIEVADLKVDTSKFILDRTICTYGFSLEVYKKVLSSKLSIISMNHFGALAEYTFGLPNVGGGFSFSEQDFLKFLRNPLRYFNSKLKFEQNDSIVKIFLDDIELKPTQENINIDLTLWRDWISNFNPFNSLVVMYTEKPEVLAEFDKLPYAKKVCFVPFETNLDSGFYIKPYYVGGRSFEATVDKIATNQITCFNMWEVLTSAKKIPVNLHSKSRVKEIKPGASFSHNNIHFFNWYEVPKNVSNWFWVKFIEDYVGKDKVFNIYFPFGDHRFVRQHNAKNKIFITGEDVFTWSWYDGYQDYCLDSVDLALGYEYLDNPKYIRFPSWIGYVVDGHKISKEQIKQRFDEINAARSTCKYQCVVINGHDMMNTRTPIYEKLKDVVQIKCAGKWNNNTDELKTVYGDDKIKYVHEFKFNICSENANRFGYVTEKIFDAFKAGSIPIYYGSDNNPEEGIINKNAVLFWNPDSDSEELVKEVIRLKTDENYYNKFMAQEKLYSKNATEFIYTTFEKLAKKLKEM